MTYTEYLQRILNAFSIMIRQTYYPLNAFNVIRHRYVLNLFNVSRQYFYILSVFNVIRHTLIYTESLQKRLNSKPSVYGDEQGNAVRKIGTA